MAIVVVGFVVVVVSVVVDVGNKLLDGSVTSTRLGVNSMRLFLLIRELLCQIFTKLSHLFHSNDLSILKPI